jgi:hypothetical protein
MRVRLQQFAVKLNHFRSRRLFLKETLHDPAAAD